MPAKVYPPFSDKIPSMLHGADYNPDQWQQYPDVLTEDIRLMKLAKCNVMSVGIFAWASLEPEEGIFTFEWLDGVLDRFAKNGIYAFLATPSGARPAWMSAAYPEVLRVNRERVRNIHGFRHNHCYTSPVYRDKVEIMNSKLAERYSQHPAVIGWHISNEYGGDCHCDYCQEAFREWLKRKYVNLDALNHAWWTTFWSHTYSDWAQVESPSPRGEMMVHGQNLDWKRFVTDQTVDFYRHEIKPLKEINPALPATTNFMDLYEGLNYWKFADVVDVVSWDAYPTWHDASSDRKQATWFSFNHDIFRSIKGGQPFLLMESTPSLTNWQEVSKNKRPGMHLLSSLHAVAHGSDSVQYFQWRKSRGSSEKFHGAVVDHVGHEHTRVFRDVAEVGDALEKLNEVKGSSVQPEVAIIFDWENRWAIKDAQGPRNVGIKYEDTVIQHYQAFWDLGIPVAIIDMEQDLSAYKLVIAPMLYMVRPGVGERIEQLVQSGGTFVATYWSGIVDENDLCFLGGFPGPLRKTLGIWSEEIDGLHERDKNGFRMVEGNSLGLSGDYELSELCDLIHVEGAEVLASYTNDFYVGKPALTVNTLGKGQAYYIAARSDESFHTEFYRKLVTNLGISKVIDSLLPTGVTVQMRSDGESDFVFLLNFSGEKQEVTLDDHSYTDLLTEEAVQGNVHLQQAGAVVLKRPAKAY
ncbi:beta-galactosidase [Paenibacillus crassostreae]|uniref:Beta-galactosidase n=1 Tax=Paenibacillus crassostreae TaxID=1763538 RepID=A0A167AIZ0_9BACL|nr:beta-galactosidase [Paenibacillus crassostreae]AOZ92370.1 beta-galactosidase [Paenibacillus crassostreae]OAB71085.1 beta-galactosidase [Paenibacillus crassostreae]